MLTLYLACLICGGVLLAISMFTGGDGGADVEHGLDVHVDTSLDAPASGELVELPNAGDQVAFGDHGANTVGDVAHGGALSAAFEFFSFRNIVYLTTFFGLTGSVLTLLNTPAIVTTISALGMGSFAMWVGHKFMKYLKSSESGQALHVRDLIGHVAVVSLPPTRSGRGKIRVRAGDRFVELLALVHPDSRHEQLPYGARVFVLDIERNTAFVDAVDEMDEEADSAS